jgi:general secretion pathway protein K
MRAQRGVALVTAILVLSLATIAATAILASSNIAIHRAANLQDSERAWWYADGVESWVKSVLARDAEDNQTDSFKDIWAKPVDYLPVDEGYVRGGVFDLQGRFNLNNLGIADKAKRKPHEDLFMRLLQQVAPDLDSSQAKALVDSIHDWIDADSETTDIDGAEDTEYVAAEPLPYRAANRAMASVSELLAVKGMTRELYTALTHCGAIGNLPQSCITALPQAGTAINVNTAPVPVLHALAANPGQEQVIDKFAAERADQPADNANTFAASVPGGIIPNLPLAVSSSFFMLHGEAFIGSGHMTINSFYYRPSSGRVAVYARSTDAE